MDAGRVKLFEVPAENVADDMPCSRQSSSPPRRVMLAQHSDDLLLAEPASLHLRSLFLGPDASRPWGRDNGSCHFAYKESGRCQFSTLNRAGFSDEEEGP